MEDGKKGISGWEGGGRALVKMSKWAGGWEGEGGSHITIRGTRLPLTRKLISNFYLNLLVE